MLSLKTADQLLKDVKELDGSIQSLKLTPEQIVAGAMELLNEAGISKITGEEERYSRIDLVDLMAMWKLRSRLSNSEKRACKRSLRLDGKTGYGVQRI